MATKDFYHYTDKKGIQDIQKTGYIMPSQTGGPDAMHGPGVYGTKLPPTSGKGAIARNNWDGIGARGLWEQRESQGRADYAIHMKIPAERLKEYNIGGRHIYVHEGPIPLQGHSAQIKKVETKK